MKKLLPLLLILFVVTNAFANEIEGTWKTKIQGPEGDIELTYVFKMDNEKLTGVIQSSFGDTQITNTKINGKEFSFDISFNDMTIKYHCTLNEDNTITAKVTGTPMGDAELLLKRA